MPLRARLLSTTDSLPNPSARQRRLAPLPALPCSLEALELAYQAPVDFTRDGLYLLHKEGLYLPGSTSPLALLWKDTQCSRFLLDTDAQGVPLKEQQVVLELRMDCTVATEDEPPVVLGRMPASMVHQQQLEQEGTAPQAMEEEKEDQPPDHLRQQQQPVAGTSSPASASKLLRPGKLLRFAIGPGGLMFSPDQGVPCGADLRYLGAANQRRGRADQFSKIMFQHLARHRPITVDQLLQAVKASEQQQQASAIAEMAEG